MVSDSSWLSLTEAAKALPPIGGKRIHPSSLWRWCRRGVRGLKLRYARFGGRIAVQLSDIETFALDLAKLDAEHGPRLRNDKPATPRGRSEKQRAADVAAARAKLAEAGIA